MSSTRQIRLILLLLLLLLLPGCGKEEMPQAADAPPVKIVQVATLDILPKDMVEEFTLPGSLEAWKDLQLAAEVSGIVEEISVEEGGQVRKGQELVHIDTLTLQANLDSARSEFEMRRKTAERFKKLLAEKLVSAQEYDNAVSLLEIAQANLRSAQIMLQKGRLEAPISGVLETRFIEPGEYVSVGDPLVRLVQIDRLKININVPEKDIPFLHKGDKIRIEGASINGYGYKLIEGRISRVGLVGSEQTRTYSVQVELQNPERALRPGMIVRTRFIRRHLDQVLVVPLYAVVERDGRKYIFVKEGDLARRRQVEIGAILNDNVVILDGLESGDTVIVKGQQFLADKVKIQVEDAT